MLNNGTALANQNEDKLVIKSVAAKTKKDTSKKDSHTKKSDKHIIVCVLNKYLC